MARAAIAVRVSPRPQENVRYSPEIQEQKCREWAEREGHEVVTVVQDILVSGGSSSRFDSIFAAIEQHTPELFIVSDLSRWTRDKPSRFWAIKALLEDQGVQLVSVDEPWLGSETPFSDTVTTATVEMNYQERLRLKRKTSEGVRKAWAAGKRWGRPFGWTFDKTTGWSQDAGRIIQFYTDWIEGVSGYEMAHRYGMFETNIRTALSARCQIDVVGQELWDKAQTARRRRGVRRDTSRSSIYRGLLVCPFCGGILQQATHWGHYKCHKHHLTPHGWWSLSARLYVTPEVEKVLGHLREPERASSLAPALHTQPQRDLAAEKERLTVAWVRGNLSTEKYESMLADIETEERESQRRQTPATPQAVEHVRELSVLGLEDRDPDTGNMVNELLRGVIDRIEIAEDRTPNVVLKAGIEGWVYPD